MKNSRIHFLNILMGLAVIGLMLGFSQFTLADGGNSSPPATESQEDSPSSAPPDNITNRGINRLAPRAGMGTPFGTIAPPTSEPTGFKCSPNTGRCNCAGLADCNYMKDLIKDSCGKITCTGSGSSQKCSCTINGY